MRTYLPDIDVSDVVHALASQDWSVIERKIQNQQYERLGLDRALAIASDLLMQHQKLTGLKILDVGCNNGLVAKVLSALGCVVVGIDNSDVDTQGLYIGLGDQLHSLGFEFQPKDLADFLDSDERHWDCILMLSVMHHWETGYAMSGERRYSDEKIRQLLEDLFRRSRLCIYYECPRNEPGFKAGSGIDFLLRHCSELPKIRYLGNTVGPNGYLRDFWALDTEC